MDYTNKEYYDYILKIDTDTNPLHKLYQNILKILISNGLNNPITEECKKEFFDIMEYRNYKLNEPYFYEVNNLLYLAIQYKRAIKGADGAYYIYPELENLPKQKDLLMYYSIHKNMDIKEIKDYLEPIIESKKNELNNSKIENYYGDINYIILRTKTIYDAIAVLNNRIDVKNKKIANQSLTSVGNLLKTMLSITNLDNSSKTFSDLNEFNFSKTITKESYDLLRNAYIEVLNNENQLLDISDELWKNYAVNNNGVLIHQLTGDLVESIKMDKICTSFYSNNANNITLYKDANVGYVYPMSIKKVFSVCGEDVGSWKIDKKEFIDSGFPKTWQLEETGLWYEYPCHTRLLSPEYVENEVKENNAFAEIIIDNRNHDVKPLYCFYTSNASEKQITEITQLAKNQGLEVQFLAAVENTKK